VVAPLAVPVMRPRWCLRCLTFLGINISVTIPGTEVGGLVVLAHRTLDLLLLGEEALEVGVGLLDEGGGLVELGLGRRRVLGAAAGGGGRHDLAGATVAGGVADGHGRFLGDLVLGGGLVGQDVALVDPDLHTDAAVGGLGLAEAVVDVGAQRV